MFIVMQVCINCKSTQQGEPGTPGAVGVRGIVGIPVSPTSFSLHCVSPSITVCLWLSSIICHVANLRMWTILFLLQSK